MHRTIRYALLLCAVGLIAASGATAGSLITGAKVKDGSLTGKDVKDRSLTAKDFKAGSLPANRPGPAGATGIGITGATGPAGTAGPAGTTGLTLKVYTLPDSVRTPEPSTTSAGDSHPIGSVAGYNFRMTCIDSLRPDTQYDDYHYSTEMSVAIAGDNLANSYAGNVEAFSYTASPGTPSSQTYTYNTDATGEMSNTFSRTTGEVVRVVARVVVDQDSCEYRNVKLYVWS